MFREYRNGELVNLSGDLNGDGRRDLVAKTRPDLLSIFLSRDTTFSKSADRTLPLPEHTRFGVADIDADGRSDIVVYSDPAPDTNEQAKTLVYFSRRVPE